MKEKATKLMSVKRSLFVLLLSVLATFQVFAQGKEVTGVVTDEKGEPAIGATVKVMGTSIGAITDFNGVYNLKNVPEDAKKIEVSYMGFVTKELDITGSKVDAKLEEEAAKKMEDLVVVGYGPAVERKDLTGTVSGVNSKSLKDIPIPSAEELMSGKLAGVQVTTTEGSPDAEVKIRVRGGGSITGDNTPLYIVDGFPVSSISDIAPSNIKSIEVMKDASATAIYGSRGANGVIMITTKDGADGKITVNYSGTFGWKKIAKTLDVLDSYEFAKYQYDYYALTGKTDDYASSYGVFDDMDIYNSKKASNWQKEIYGNTGYNSTHSISVNGGKGIFDFNLNYTRDDNKAIMYGSEYERDNLSLKVNAKPMKKLKFNLTSKFSDKRVVGAGANDVNASEKSTQDSRLKHTVIYAPFPVVDLSSQADQSILDDIDNGSSLYNPYTSVDDNYKYKDDRNFNINGYAQYELLKNLVAKVEAGYDKTTKLTNQYYGLTTYYQTSTALIKVDPITGQRTVSAYVTNQDQDRFRNTNTLSYNFKQFLKKTKHSADLLFGHELISTSVRTTTDTYEGLSAAYSNSSVFNHTGEAQRHVRIDSYSPDDNMVSFFGRFNYDYAKRYLITGTLRADGSSKFAAGNQWGYFPSVALGWRISDEKFMKFSKGWLYDLKLRLSYGASGNNNIASSAYRKVYSETSAYNVSVPYLSAGNVLENPDLKWETTYTRNVGLDFGFFKDNRINGTIDMYYNNTKDLLIEFPIAGSGYQTQYRNLGETSNKGLEFVLNGVILDNPKADYGLDVSANMSFNRGKVESLGGLSEITAASGWTSRITDDYKVYEGQPVGLMYGYVTEGRYTTDDFTYNGTKWVANAGVVDNSAITSVSWGPGAIKFKDLNNDGVITDADKTVIGNSNPDFTGGLNISARYKGFDFAAGFTFSYGNDVYNANKIEFTSNDANYKNRNMISEMSSSNRWNFVDASGNIVTDATTLASMNESTSLWSPYYRYCFHSWAVEDGSYFRLNNVTLGYTIPKKYVAKVWLQQARVYFTATNLFCITNYSGFDPEVDTRRSNPLTPAVDYSAYPKSRGYNVGLNLTF